MTWHHILHGYLAALLFLTAASLVYLAVLTWRKP